MGLAFGELLRGALGACATVWDTGGGRSGVPAYAKPAPVASKTAAVTVAAIGFARAVLIRRPASRTWASAPAVALPAPGGDLRQHGGSERGRDRHECAADEQPFHRDGVPGAAQAQLAVTNMPVDPLQ